VLRLMIATAVGRTAGRMSRLLGRGGSAVPGLVAERLDPRTIERLAASLRHGVVVVTGTNGKTTTTKMLVRLLTDAGRSVVTNRTGSNLARGIASALMDRAGRRGTVDADLAVFEVDEAAVRTLAPRLSPRVMVVTNLARDQLDRFGELQTTAGHVAAALRHAGTAVLNADDPLVADLATAGASFFGASQAIRAEMPADAALYSPGDASPRRSEPAVELAAAAPSGDGLQITLTVPGGAIDAVLQVPGIYNGYNAAAAVAAALELGVDPAGMRNSLELTEPAFGRGQVIEYRGRRIKVLLVKNPAGFNQAIRLLAAVPAGASVLVAINDLDADGRDVSWLWDARLEDLGDSGHRFGATGIRAEDMALRLKYAGIDSWSDPNIGSALARFVESAPEGSTAYVVPTYTAMLDLLELLLPGTHPAEIWR
jgi:UDP-N-acetylmuramyl tripeptide synthase